MNWTGFKAKLSSFGKKVSSSVKKYKTHLTISGVAIATLFGILLLLPGGHITTSGDFICGVECNSTINYTNSQYDIKVCNISNLGVQVYFDKAIKSYQIYLKSGGDWVQNISSCIEKKKNEIWEFKLVGQKNPYDTVKWSVKIGNVLVDPVWFGGKLTINKTDIQYDATHFLILFNLTSSVNYTIDDPDVIHMVKDKVKGNSDINYFEFRIRTQIIYFNETESLTCPLPYFYNYTSNPRHLWCWENYTTSTDNITFFNATRLIFEHDFDTANMTTRTIYYNETQSSGGDYVKFNPIGKTIEANKTYELGFYAEKNIEFGSSAIHFDFFFADNNMNMTWWNTTCATRWALLGSATIANQILYANDTFGIGGSGNTLTYQNQTDQYAYNCTYGSTARYVVGSSSVQLYWENGTRNDGNSYETMYNQSGLLAFWKFDGTNWKNDSTDSGHNLTIGGTTPVQNSTAKFGQAAYFNGVNGNYFQVPVANMAELLFTGTTPFTLEAWTFRTDINSYGNIYRIDTFGTPRTALILRYDTDNTIFMLLGDITLGLHKTCNSNATVTTIGWHHVAATYNPIGNYMRIYLDGVAVGNCTAPVLQTWALTSTCLTIGDGGLCGATQSEPIKGSLDDMRILNYSATPTEINETTKQGINQLISLGTLETYSASSGPDLNLSFGPASTTSFMWVGCDPDAENASALPENQTSTYGIDQICNNGSATANADINLSGTIGANWTIWASNVSTFATNLTLSGTAAQRIYTGLTQGSCTYIWFKANCSYANIGPGVYEQYWVSA